MSASPKYEEVPVTPHLLARLWTNLWERGETELGWLGLTVQDGFYAFMMHARNAEKSAILLCDGAPVLIAGIVKEKGESFTFMQATKDFERHVRAIIRMLKSHVASYASDPLYIYSVCVHPSTPRFFRAVGFVPDEYRETTNAGHPLYRFIRR